MPPWHPWQPETRECPWRCAGDDTTQGTFCPGAACPAGSRGSSTAHTPSPAPMG